ncbi:hypothetical protein Hdeb2414_s0023g00628171 [Helianthus debilis subsp. tardiflorus]
MLLSSHVFSGANSNLGNCVAIRISIMKARSRNGTLAFEDDESQTNCGYDDGTV